MFHNNLTSFIVLDIFDVAQVYTACINTHIYLPTLPEFHDLDKNLVPRYYGGFTKRQS